jgi:hypothetical protein
MADVPPVPPVFYRCPGEYVNAGDQFVDWRSEREIKNWKVATAALEDKFDLKRINLNAFLNRVQERGQAFNWAPILLVPHGDQAVPTNLISNYGVVSLESCQAHARVYLAQRERASQLSAMMYEFLRKSLTNEANKTIDLYPSAYTVNGLTDGLCLLKQIIIKSYVDNKSTVTMVRRSIGKLDDKIRELKYDIKAFNQYVEMQVYTLTAYNYKCEELVPNLFTAYMAFKDDEFLHLVRMHYFQHEQERAEQDEDYASIMRALENHYHRRLIDGTWNPTITKSDKERIIALETTIADLRADSAKVAEAKATNDNGKRNGDPEGKWAWKRTPPNVGKPTTFNRNNKQYHCCPKHKMWTIHTPEECTLVVKDNNKQVANTTVDVKEKEKEKSGDNQAMNTIISSNGRMFD